MSPKKRYIILTLIFIGVIILLTFIPKFTGMIINVNTNYNSSTNCQNASKYYDCVQCCQEKSDNIYGAQYYGVTGWSESYNDCWSKYCQNFSNGAIDLK